MKDENASPYMQGYRAYNEGKGVRDNPYPEGSKEYELWWDGWRIEKLRALLQFDYRPLNARS